MQRAARNLPDTGANDVALSPTMLAELREAHRQLHIEVANMEAITRGPQPDADRLAKARWRISQASLRRRLLSARIRDALLPVVSVEDRVLLNSIQKADLALHSKSRAHVSTWTTERDRFEQDWQGYCKAAQLMLSHTRAHITLEQRILCPIIDIAERRGRPA